MKFNNLLLSLFIVSLALSSVLCKKNRKKGKKPGNASLRNQNEIGCDGDVDFELITGFVYFVSDFIIDSKAGELKLEDCIDYCRENSKCKSVNFETGLCVLLEASAGEKTGRSISELQKNIHDFCRFIWIYVFELKGLDFVFY